MYKSVHEKSTEIKRSNSNWSCSFTKLFFFFLAKLVSLPKFSFVVCLLSDFWQKPIAIEKISTTDFGTDWTVYILYWIGQMFLKYEKKNN